MKVITVKHRSGHVSAVCECGWQGPLNPTRTAEGYTLAERDAEQHEKAHENHTGFFDYEKGWTRYRACDTSELLRQIGGWNLAAISGGRVIRRETGVTLPVGAGYSVTVDLDASDTYVVSRVFKRGDKIFPKGTLSNVYADEVGERAYEASSFRSYEFPRRAS